MLHCANAQMSGVQMSGAQMSDAQMSGAQMSGAQKSFIHVDIGAEASRKGRGDKGESRWGFRGSSRERIYRVFKSIATFEIKKLLKSNQFYWVNIKR
jgi:uncharacterized protein YjbI with pentapeptide repeats